MNSFIWALFPLSGKGSAWKSFLRGSYGKRDGTDVYRHRLRGILDATHCIILHKIHSLRDTIIYIQLSQLSVRRSDANPTMRPSLDKRINLQKRTNNSSYARAGVSSRNPTIFPTRGDKARSDKEVARARIAVPVFPEIFFRAHARTDAFILVRARNVQCIRPQLFIDTHIRACYAIPRDTLYLSFIIYRRRNSAHCFPKHCN